MTSEPWAPAVAASLSRARIEATEDRISYVRYSLDGERILYKHGILVWSIEGRMDQFVGVVGSWDNSCGQGRYQRKVRSRDGRESSSSMRLEPRDTFFRSGFEEVNSRLRYLG